MSSTFSDQAVEILRHTSDGDDLDPSELSLIQDVVNTSGKCLTESGRIYWQNLHRLVMSGEYASVRAHFCGVPGLTQNHAGYISWRGVYVEHYDHRDRDAMVAAARLLGAVCLEIEARGEEVSFAAVSRFYDSLHFGDGLRTARHHLIWTLEEGGPRISLRSIAAKRHVDSRAKCDAHHDEVMGAWGLPRGSARSLTLATREDYDALVASLDSDQRWATSHRWAAYESGRAVSAVMDVVHKVVSRDALPSRADVLHQMLGSRLAEVTAQSQANLQRVEQAFAEEPVRERMTG